MAHTIAMKAFAAGDKVFPLSQNLGVERTQVWRYLNDRTPVQARTPPQSGAGSSARTKQTKKPAGFVPAGSDCSALSAGPKRQDNRIRNCKPTLEPVARGDICHPIPSRPVCVMATATVRVHWDSRNRRHGVARHDGVNNSRPMMSNVSIRGAISLRERRRTEQSDSRYRC
jgi:hypothetical protein